MVFETILHSDLQKLVQVEQLTGNLFSADNGGNKITVEILDGGAPATLSGGVTGYIIRADGATVVVNGTLSGNKVSIVLPESAYTVVGQVSIVIKNSTTTVGACTAYVYRTTTDVIVDPGSVVPDISELLAKIADCDAATAAANAAAGAANTAAANVGGNLAANYSASATYAVGDYCIKDGTLYRCTTAITSGENWNSGHWTAAKIGPDVSASKSSLFTDEKGIFNSIGIMLKDQFTGISKKDSGNAGNVSYAVVDNVLQITRTATDSNRHTIMISMPALTNGDLVNVQFQYSLSTGDAFTPYAYLASDNSNPPTKVIGGGLTKDLNADDIVGITFIYDSTNFNAKQIVIHISSSSVNIPVNSTLSISNLSVKKLANIADYAKQADLVITSNNLADLTTNVDNALLDDISIPISATMKHTGYADHFTYSVANSVLSITRTANDSNGHRAFITLPPMSNGQKYSVDIVYSGVANPAIYFSSVVDARADALTGSAFTLYQIDNINHAKITFVYDSTNFNAKYIMYYANQMAVNETIVFSDFVTEKYLVAKDIVNTADDPVKLRVIQYNIGKLAYGNGQSAQYDAILDEKLQTIKQTLGREVNADIISLNEYPGYLKSDEQQTTKSVLFDPLYPYLNRYWGTSHMNWACTAIASKATPIQFVPFTVADETQADRRFIKARYRIGGKEFAFASIHLSPSSTEEQKTLELTETFEYLADEENVIICGDMNWNASNATMMALVSEAGYIQANNGYFGDYETRPLSGSHIDNIFVKGRIKIENAYVPDVYDKLVSDHLPVVADVVIY